MGGHQPGLQGGREGTEVRHAGAVPGVKPQVEGERLLKHTFIIITINMIKYIHSLLANLRSTEYGFREGSGREKDGPPATLLTDRNAEAKTLPDNFL